ncbi:MAG: HEAT repeat domain-containing protein [Verrucomicrobiota bacterium]
MKKSVRILLVIVALALSGVAYVYVTLRGPAHQGRPITAWLEQLASPKLDQRATAREALRQMGPTAYNYLLKQFNFQESELNTRVTLLFGLPYENQLARRLNAVRGFRALGEVADPAVPKLVVLLNDNETCMYAADSLGGVGKGAVPALTPLLEQGSANAKLGAATAMIAIGPDAQPAIPGLLKCLKDQDTNLREAAARALGAIGKEPEKVVPPLIEALADESNRVRARAAEAVGKFGKDAVAALPALEKLARLRVQEVPVAALDAIRNIDPERAAAVEKSLPPPPPAPPGGAP